MNIGENIKRLREQLGMSQEELATKMGYKSRSAITKIEKGQRDINQKKIKEYAKALNTSPAVLMGIEVHTNDSTDYDKYDNIEPITTKRIPMLGSIACGQPIFAEEEHEMYVPVSDDIKADFCLRTKGDSMVNAKIFDGDIVFIKKQDMVENGEIAVVIISDEATLKRVYYDQENNIIQLIAENPAYSPMVYSGSQLNQIRILGKAVAVLSML
ncbi:MAG: S24 family peptidase [Oscillospiraceae bacterium]|nr:S24 family peptidase [Oscillospiraceae bacterium]